MKTDFWSFKTGVALIAILLLQATCSGRLCAQAAPNTLWQIGQVDKSDKEFALAPDGSTQYKQDAFYVIGKSNPGQDWPYVQPGPADSWAGGRRHTNSILFGLSSVGDGNCDLALSLVDAQDITPPTLEIAVNGNIYKEQTVAGGGDTTIGGHPENGKNSVIDVSFPASQLKTGLNTITITTTQGSWILYDAVGMSAPVGTTLSDATSFAEIVSAKWLHDTLVVKNAHYDQVLQLSTLNAGNAQTYHVAVSGEGVVAVVLPTGKATQELDFPESSGSQDTLVSLTDSGLPNSAAIHAMRLPCKRFTIYEIEHSHMDIGYAYLQQKCFDIHAQDITDSLGTISKTATYPYDDRFRWNCESLIETQQWLKKATPAQIAQFVHAVRNGDIGLSGLYCNELTGLCRPEELVALLADANEMRKKYDIPIDSAMISDVPGYTWGMVPVFAESGIKYWSWGPNPNDHLGSARNWDNQAFYWISPSGKDKVLVWQSINGYQTSFWDGDTLDNFLTSFDQRFPSDPFDMIYERHTINDNGPTDPNFDTFVHQWNSHYAYPHIIMATTSQMFHAFEAKYGKNLPELHGDYTGYWEDGAVSTALETAVNRNSADSLAQDDILWSMINPVGYPHSSFDDGWRNAALYDEHTWGADQSWWNPESDFTKAQWAYKRQYAINTQGLAATLKMNVLAQMTPSASSAVYAVFNTSNWPRTELIELTAAQSAAGDIVKNEAGAIVPSQRLADGSLAFLAAKVPPFSSEKFMVSAGKSNYQGSATASATQIGNGLATLVFDPQNGSVTSWKSDGITTDLVNAADPTCRGLNDYMYVLGDDNRVVTYAANAKITVVDSGPLVATVSVDSDAPGCNGLIRTYRLVDGMDDVWISDTLDKKQVRDNEGVNLGFNFNVPNGVIRLDEPWSVVRPDVDQMLYSNRSVFPANRWVDVSNADYGITTANLDTPMVQVGRITQPREDEGGWLDYSAPGSTIDWQVMNNYWHTNYKAYQSGPVTFRYVLEPHVGFDQGSAQRFGTEESEPMTVAPVSSRAKDFKLPLTVSNDNVMVTACHPRGDGSWMVRLFNSSNQPQKVVVNWSGAPSVILQRTDLFSNNPVPTLPETTLAPMEIETLKIVP